MLAEARKHRLSLSLSLSIGTLMTRDIINARRDRPILPRKVSNASFLSSASFLHIATS